MPRVEIDLPERFTFRTELPVRISDVNYGQHVGNDRILSFAHEARAQLFAAHGWTELDIAGSGVGIAIADVAAVYASEARYGMTLVAELAAGEPRSRGFVLWTRLSDLASRRDVARIRNGIVFFDYPARKVAHMPAAFRSLFAAGS